ncbi:MAG: hypothetical protein ACYDAR_03845 [Thermomicrobiales bacterium]
METIFELWDVEEAYPLNTYTEMSEALTVVAATVRQYGEVAVETWGLFRSTPGGEITETVAEGRDLAQLAMGEKAGSVASD